MLSEQLSGQVRDVLLKYPHWAHRVQSALTKPPFKLGYSASVIEMFDSYGLLGGMAWGQVYETERIKGQPTEFVAWYLDGQLGLFYVGNEIVVNRLNLMSASSAILLGLGEV